LIELFARRAPIPNDHEFPYVKPKLDSYEFPHEALPEQLLAETLSDTRLQAIRRAVREIRTGGAEVIAPPVVKYHPEWVLASAEPDEQLDLVFSQAALEHADNLWATHWTMYRWVRPGGFVSHHIDFTSHDFAQDWNGHWTYSDFVWSLIVGRRAYAINREPCSAHLKLLAAAGFHVVSSDRSTADSRISPHNVAARFSGLTEQDLITTNLFVQARRPPHEHPHTTHRAPQRPGSSH
jgi:hypothetical protein